ncbi:MAG TPA: hypothetical protein VFU31_24585 [Candidatus Binatia bacterium]|nr:hypothetical protein [Candidatus Binatia bacterium]
MGLGGSKQSTTTTEPPAWARPYSEDLLADTWRLTRNNYTPYGGQRVVPMTGTQKQAVGLLGETAQGKYLEGNPYLDAAINKSQQEALDVYNQQLQPALTSRAVRARAFGGSGYDEAMRNMQGDLLDTIGEIGVGARAGAYEAERGRQTAAMPMYLGAAGIEQQSLQDQASAAYEDWLFQQQFPYQQQNVRAEAIRGALAGGGYGVQMGPNPYASNRLGNTAGLGLLGYGVGGPWGAGIGAGLGLLM